jgi:diadenosine tetraphosphate (Ap4A) HIT family hydrolase
MPNRNAPSDCLACVRIKAIQNGTNPFFITELKYSYVVAEDFQRYPGYCLLLHKEHREQMTSLAEEVQTGWFAEVAQVANAINQEFAPNRINYELLGNSLPHLHWHVIPRYSWDPEPSRTIWTRPGEERMRPYVGVDLADVIRRIRDRLR